MIQLRCGDVMLETEGSYITKNKIAVELPDIHIPPGLNDVVVEACFNGQ